MAPSIRRFDLLRHPLDRFIRALPGIEDGDVRAVHRARVASRRLGEVVPILQLDDGQAEKLLRRVRRLRRKLGALRELDVLAHLLEELREAGGCDRNVVRLVSEPLSEHRERLRHKIEMRAVSAELGRTARQLGRIARGLKDESVESSRALRWRSALDARVAVRAARLKKVIAAAGALYLPERLHVVRLAVKKLRYAVELSAAARQTADAADVRLLKRGQELLGRMRDLQLLIDHVRRVHAALPVEHRSVARELDRLVAAVEDSCRRLHARYVRERRALLATCDRLRTRVLRKTPRDAARAALAGAARRAG
jgi:CHAD domain-containing protein